MLTDNTRNYLLGFKGYMTKSNTCLFATVLCLIPENFTDARKKKIREMDWQLVADQLFYRKIYGYFMQCISTGEDSVQLS